MASKTDLLQVIEEIAERDGRYNVKAYLIVLDGLDYARGKLNRTGHVTGRELLEAIRDMMLDRYGPLSATVLAHWGVGSTEDIGNIVFCMVEAGVLGKTEKDSQEDFRNVYDFHEVFEKEYRFGGLSKEDS